MSESPKNSELKEEESKLEEEEEEKEKEEKVEEAPNFSKIRGKKILVTFEEKEQSLLEYTSEIRSYTGTGQVMIKNPAKEEIIWSVRLKLADCTHSNLQEDEYIADDLEPDSKWSMNYQLTTKQPAVKLDELIDTDFNLEKPDFTRDDLVFNGETNILFMISVENLLTEPMTEITIKKNLPVFMRGSPRFLEPFSGETVYDSENHVVSWTLEDVAPEDVNILKIYGAIKPNQVEPMDMGEVRVEYKQINRGIITNIKPELTAQTTVMSFVEAVEGDTANMWDCMASFEGNKEYQVLLEGISVTDKQSGETLFDSGELNELLSAQGDWSSSFVARSEKMPQLKHHVIYRVPWDVTRSLTGTIIKEASMLPIIKVEITKEFDPPSVPSYARTPVTVRIFVHNIGSAAVHHLRIYDHLPPYCLLDADSITIHTDDTATEVCEHTLQELDPQHRRQLTIDGKSTRMDIPLLPLNAKTMIQYNIIAEKLVPGEDYHSPLMVHAFGLPPARTPNEARTLVDKEDPFLGVIYTKRAIRIGKTIIPKRPGTFRVHIQVHNLGGVDLERIEVTHVIPPNYRFEENFTKTLNYEEETTDEGTKITWTILRIAPDEVLEIEYQAIGEGEFKPEEPEVHVPKVA